MCTPAILLDLDVLTKNVKTYQAQCDAHGKELWPMLKTHKSLLLAKMQADAGAAGFLCGTLDECEALCDAGYEKIMYAYPVASPESAARVVALAQKCRFVLRVDGVEGARAVNAAAEAAGIIVDYTIIVDCGLHRFGVAPDQVVALKDALADCAGLRFVGISSHSGQVYAAVGPEEVPGYAEEERRAIATAVEALRAAGCEPTIVGTGSTPTFAPTIGDPNIRMYHPGNYVFNDCIQMANGTCTEADCALTVLATVISHPSEQLYICDAGAKCLGLDQGAHGNSSIVGFGRVKGHPELIVAGLSEEVGKLKVIGETMLRVGDKVEIIPNHACSTANLTNYYVAVRGGETVGCIEVDIRGNAKMPKSIGF